MGLRFSDEGRDALNALANHYGISMADVVEMLVRRELRREGLVVGTPREI